MSQLLSGACPLVWPVRWHPFTILSLGNGSLSRGNGIGSVSNKNQLTQGANSRVAALLYPRGEILSHLFPLVTCAELPKETISLMLLPPACKQCYLWRDLWESWFLKQWCHSAEPSRVAKWLSCHFTFRACQVQAAFLNTLAVSSGRYLAYIHGIVELEGSMVMI